VPESKKRKKVAYTPPPTSAGPKKRRPSPRWLAPLMLVLFGLGVLWLVVFYITESRFGGLPVASELGNWNLLVGFGFIIAGFGLSTQWR
jgi:hypothetical protein